MPTTDDARRPHLRRQGDATQLIVDGHPFLILGGEAHNSSASSLEYMERHVWHRLRDLHGNTALVPISWELLEPAEGVFDYALVDGLIHAARRYGLKLVFLWFGTWKNGRSTYTPAWVKTDTARFFRTETELGKKIDAVSCVCDAGAAADARAFSLLMRRIREIDERDHTVLMVQVENEVGLLGAPRDRCPQAEAAFAQPVPPALTEYLRVHASALLPEVGAAWVAAGRRTEGGWADVFGEIADEAFMAWHVAAYVEAVAAAGKAEYPLPLFANAWLVQHDGQAPGKYPSGGPVSRMMDIWRAAAPSLDLLAPDIYLEDFASVCASYARRGNPLLIPEARRDHHAAANVFWAFAAGAIGFAPFGIESVLVSSNPVAPEELIASPAGAPSTEAGDRLASSYRLLSDMMPLLTSAQGTGRLRGILQRGDEPEEWVWRGYRFRIRYNHPREAGRTPGAGLVLAAGGDEFVVAGHGFSLQFLPITGEPGYVDYLSLDEGDYRNGHWVPGRRLNGDEYALRLGSEPAVRRANLYRY